MRPNQMSCSKISDRLLESGFICLNKIIVHVVTEPVQEIYINLYLYQYQRYALHPEHKKFKQLLNSLQWFSGNTTQEGARYSAVQTLYSTTNLERKDRMPNSRKVLLLCGLRNKVLSLVCPVPHEPKCEYDSLNEVAVELLHLQPGQPIDDQANIQDALEGVFRLTCALKTEDRDPTKGLREFVHQIKTDKRFADLRQV